MSNNPEQNKSITHPHALPGVAVITATLGRPSLIRALESVKMQTYPNIKQYLIVDGPENKEFVDNLLDKYPNTIAIHLPVKIGSSERVNGPALSTALYYLTDDLICFLDDDNWYDCPNHIADLVRYFYIFPNLDFAYSNRSFYLDSGKYICEDNSDSLGFFKIATSRLLDNGLRINSNYKFFADTNTIMVTNSIAKYYGDNWDSGLENDKVFFNSLIARACSGVYNARFSSAYMLSGYKNTLNESPEFQAETLKYMSDDVVNNKRNYWYGVPHVFLKGELMTYNTYLERHPEAVKEIEKEIKVFNSLLKPYPTIIPVPTPTSYKDIKDDKKI